MYHTYILKCKDQTLYTGTTTDLKRRLVEHNTSAKGAKYTRSRRPVKLVYSSPQPTKSQAQKEEYRIKKLTRKQKQKLISDAKDS